MIKNYYELLGRFLRLGAKKQQQQQQKQQQEYKHGIYKQQKAQILREDYNKEGLEKYINMNKKDDDEYMALIKDKRDNLIFRYKYLNDIILNGGCLQDLTKNYGPFQYDRTYKNKEKTDDEYMAENVIPFYMCIKKIIDDKK